MKRFCLLMPWLYVCGLLLVLLANAGAQERKQIADIDSDALTRDTRTSAPVAGDHMNLIWAIPIEFWKAIFTADASMAPAQRAEVIRALEDYVIFGIVQADIGDEGEFSFYSEEEIREQLKLSFTAADGKSRPIIPSQEIGPEAQQLLAVVKPMLGAAMGNMGQNLHFIVVNDDAGEGRRIWDPYAVGVLRVTLKTRSGSALEGQIEGPVDSLFVPRKCPNGKDAHVSWKFCPWTGEALNSPLKNPITPRIE